MFKVKNPIRDYSELIQNNYGFVQAYGLSKELKSNGRVACTLNLFAYVNNINSALGAE